MLRFRRGFADFLVLSLICAGATHAQKARIAHPPPPAHEVFEEIEANPYFAQDPDDPRHLRSVAGALEHGIDRGYVERMVRGNIPVETFEALEVTNVERPEPLELPDFQEGQFGAFATAISGNVIVIEGDEQLAPNTQRGRMFDHQGSGLQRVIQQVWSRIGDQFDFITVFTTFDDAGVAAYYLPLQQDTSGLGACNFNAGETFGCRFSQLPEGSRLQGFAFMNSLSYWRNWDYNYDGRVHAYDDVDASIYAVLGQEIGHRWGSGLRFVDPRSGAVSKKLLGRDGSHWAAWVDTDASVMDGWDWDVPDNSGQFTLVGDMEGFSLLDLYAMGAVPVASPQPFFFIDNARFVPNQWVGAQSIPADAVLQLPSVALMNANGVNLKATGERVDLTIQDIVNAEGVRCPDKDHAQKVFRQAVVLITRPGQTASQAAAEVANLETVMTTWEDWWADRTRYALTLCTSLDGVCEHPSMGLGAGSVDAADGVMEPGGTYTFELPVSAQDARVRGAKINFSLSGNGAEYTTLSETEVDIGEMPPDESRNIRVNLTLDEEYPCGYSVILHAVLSSENAEAVAEEYRFFPGYRELFAATFDEGADGFFVNGDEQDSAQSGVLERSDVTLTCTMGPRTPERDVSPAGKGAFITSNENELNGTTSLWSGELDITDAIYPEIRFSYWLDGEGGSLKVLVSRSGNGFTEAKSYDEPYHGWSLGRVVLRDVYPDADSFEKVHVLFVFEGNGAVEGGIDEVRVLDFDGICAAQLNACSCSSSQGESSSKQMPWGGAACAALLLGLLGRRPKKRSASR